MNNAALPSKIPSMTLCPEAINESPCAVYTSPRPRSSLTYSVYQDSDDRCCDASWPCPNGRTFPHPQHFGHQCTISLHQARHGIPRSSCLNFAFVGPIRFQNGCARLREKRLVSPEIVKVASLTVAVGPTEVGRLLVRRRLWPRLMRRWLW